MTERTDHTRGGAGDSSEHEGSGNSAARGGGKDSGSGGAKDSAGSGGAKDSAESGGTKDSAESGRAGHTAGRGDAGDFTDDGGASGESLARRMAIYVRAVQERIRGALEDLDGGGRFRIDEWERPGGGGGVTAILEEGAVFEKAGVNTSAVFGTLPERMISVLEVDRKPFFATGISLVIHPKNPFVPAVHANFRYFALGEDLDRPDDQWFGGGADLTPIYPHLEDAQHFHSVWKGVCDRHPTADYGAFKAMCDRYFYLPHRGEARGIGGIFFDYLRDDPGATFDFVRDAGDAFTDAYLPIAARRMKSSYGEEERAFQEIRRGRYVEFNLLFDRGTKFGIETQGRTESILMSLPPRVRWAYDQTPKPGSKEASALWFFTPREWLRLRESDVPE